ncbi:MAG TPA: hypothetical protein VGU00_12520 [Sphingopyxis sp.]|nr:hypothetical protein [Sphingopyxis sp.]
MRRWLGKLYSLRVSAGVIPLVLLCSCNANNMKDESKMRIVYPFYEDGKKTSNIVLNVENRFLADKLIGKFDGPRLIALNYKDDSPASDLPWKSRGSILSYALVPPEKVPGYRSNFIDQPIGENFDWYKYEGKKEFGLKNFAYKVVNSPDYPERNLYLEEKDFHDFFLHCPDDQEMEEKTCLIGRQVELKSKDGGLYHINLYTRINPNDRSDWRVIDSSVRNFFVSRMAVEKL